MFTYVSMQETFTVLLDFGIWRSIGGLGGARKSLSDMLDPFCYELENRNARGWKVN